jgi:uncharacterized protein YjiS (DUF1127 family)
MRQIDRPVSFATLLPALAMMAPAASEHALRPAPRRRGLYRSAALGLRRSLDTLRLWRQRARGRQQLRSFDDHLLRDIGITRLQAEAEAHKPFWRA